MGVKLGGPAHSQYSKPNSATFADLCTTCQGVFSVSNSVSETKVLRCLRKMLQADEVRFLKALCLLQGRDSFAQCCPRALISL